MKIAVITLKDSPNYGGILQAYALQKVIQKMGYQCDLIDYMNCDFKKKFSFMGRPKKMSKLYWIYKKIQYPLMVYMMNKMMPFYRHMNLTKHFINKGELSSLNQDYDIFITGSDQVWACDLNFYDDSYFLSFADDKKLKISYAASFGRTWEMMNNYEKNFIKKNLERLDYISLREESGMEIVKNLTGRTDSIDVLDPTLLLDKDEWMKIGKPCKHNDYILCYLMQSRKNDSAALSFSKELSRRTGQRIIKICRGLTSVIWGETIFVPTVEDFLGLFNGASYVVTNSFHGVAFSVIFHKQFSVYVEGDASSGRNSRIFNICSKLGLLNRIKIVGFDTGKTVEQRIDYSDVDSRLSFLSDYSKNFIQKSING